MNVHYNIPGKRSGPADVHTNPANNQHQNDKDLNM
jgi:hypothetical protein